MIRIRKKAHISGDLLKEAANCEGYNEEKFHFQAWKPTFKSYKITRWAIKRDQWTSPCIRVTLSASERWCSQPCNYLQLQLANRTCSSEHGKFSEKTKKNLIDCGIWSRNFQIAGWAPLPLVLRSLTRNTWLEARTLPKTAIRSDFNENQIFKTRSDPLLILQRKNRLKMKF